MHTLSTRIGALLSGSMLLLSSAPGATLYVSSSGSDTPPYDTWAKAAHTLQAALAVTQDGDRLQVDDGTYTGNMGTRELAENVVIITNSIHVQSVHGPSQTIIQGAMGKRCVFIEGPNAILDGFTLTGGVITNIDGYPKGGGLYAADYATITNCVSKNNQAAYGGGGYVLVSYVFNSTFTSNSGLSGGGGLYVWENNADFGGHIRACQITCNTNSGTGAGIAARYATIERCTIAHNKCRGISFDGGGVVALYEPTQIQNCLIYSNSASRSGGGLYAMYGPTIQNCTIIHNDATYDGGGAYFRTAGTVENTIIYHNSGWLTSSNLFHQDSLTQPTYLNCCMAPLTNDTQCTDTEPNLAPGSWRLSANSPCVDAGQNLPALEGLTDVDGDPRRVNGTVDIGADEACVKAIDASTSLPLSSTWSLPHGARIQWQAANSLNAN